MATVLTEPTSSKVQIKQTKMLIGGKWVDSVSGKTFETINPATGEVLAMSPRAMRPTWIWPSRPPARRSIRKRLAQDAGSERGRLLNRLADLIEKNIDELATLESLDNGKPCATSRARPTCRSSSTATATTPAGPTRSRARRFPISGDYFCYTRHEPVGVVGQIIPWNFPLLMQAWKWGPALACGSTVVLKPAEQTPLTALRVGELSLEAGFPDGVINIVPGYGPTAGAAIARHMDVDKIAFTGSTEVGQLIMKAAAETNLKRVTLELGGKSPNIVFADADLDAAVEGAHFGLFFNQGQCCCAGSRLFVEEKVYDEFVERSTRARQDAARSAIRSIARPSRARRSTRSSSTRSWATSNAGKKEGAKLLSGGKRVGDRGYFIEPTVFADVKDEMKIAQEEIFGPVMSILKFKDMDEVIERAQQDHLRPGRRGLDARHRQGPLHVANNVRAGTVWVNCYDVFDAAAPFGGFKTVRHRPRTRENTACSSTRRSRPSRSSCRVRSAHREEEQARLALLLLLFVELLCSQRQ